MAETVLQPVAVGIACAVRTLCVLGLENRHLIAVGIIEHHEAADTRCPVRTIRLEFTCLKCFLEGVAILQEIIDGIRLITVGHDQVITDLTDRAVDDEARVLDLAGVCRIDGDGVTILDKYAVSGVCATTHDEVSDGDGLSICGLADHDATARVLVVLQQLWKLCYIICCHVYSPYSKTTLSSDSMISPRWYASTPFARSTSSAAASSSFATTTLMPTPML